jgi:hypothetical protein
VRWRHQERGSRYGGAITAAKISGTLRIPLGHLDIAGMEYDDDDIPIVPKEQTPSVCTLVQLMLG